MSSPEKHTNWLETSAISDKIIKVLVVLAIICAHRLLGLNRCR
jgi:hypothetical protein